jgi:hypothetical protein
VGDLKVNPGFSRKNTLNFSKRNTMMILNDASEITNEPQTVFDESDPDSKV